MPYAPPMRQRVDAAGIEDQLPRIPSIDRDAFAAKVAAFVERSGA